MWISCIAVLLAGILFSTTLDVAAAPAFYIVNQALFVCLAGYLLLPAANDLSGLFTNGLIHTVLFIVLTKLTVTTGVPLSILLQVATVVFCLALLLWSLSQLFTAVFPGKKNIRGIIILLLTCLTTAPLWMGPVVDIHQADSRLINWVVSMTPLTHVSVAAEYDYLRSEWLYRNSSFGSLPFVYPGFYSIAAGYFLLVLTLQIIIRGLTRHPQMLISSHWPGKKT